MIKRQITNRMLRPVRGTAAGFSLVELMVAITISLLILVSMVAVYVNLARSNNEMARTNIQIENGRFAIQLLQGDIAHAGYWGGYVPQFDDMSSTADPVSAAIAGGTVPTAVPAPCLDYTAADWTAEYKANLLGIPIHGYDAVPTGCSTVVTNKKSNTDVLVLRHAETCLPGVGNCEAETAGKLYLQSSFCASETATPFVLDTTGHTLRKMNCATLADKRKFISSIYYIRDYAATPGDGIPTLVRSQLDLVGSPAELKHPDATALIEGIEGFRIEFGIDRISDDGIDVINDPDLTKRYNAAVIWKDATNLVSPRNRGDGIPDGAFVRCDTANPTSDPCNNAAMMANAVAAKVFILARSREQSPGHNDTKTYKLGSAAALGPFNDGYKRQVLSTTVRLTNVSGRRETP